MNKDYLIEEAKLRYPIGTTYIPLRMDGIEYGTSYTIVEHKPFFMEKDDAVCLSTKGSGFGSVYVKGKWATIVKPEETIEAVDPTEEVDYFEEVKKLCPLDTWIPLSKEKHIHGTSFKINVKFINDYKSCYVNNNTTISFYTPGYKNNSEWQEIYKLLNIDSLPKTEAIAEEPLITNSLIGRYVKCLDDRAVRHYGGLKTGDYLLYNEEMSGSMQHWGNTDTTKPYYTSGDISKIHYFELMPEGFVPPTESTSVEKTKESQPQEEFPLTVKDLVPGKWYMENDWEENSCARFVDINGYDDFEYDRKYINGKYEEEDGSWSISENSKFKEVPDPTPSKELTKELTKKPYWKKVKCIRAASISYTEGNVYDVTDDGYVIDNIGGKRFTHLDHTNTFTGDTDFKGNSDFEEFIEHMVENTSDLKEGDWVIGWHAICGDWRDKPWQVKEVFKNPDNVDSIRPLFHTDANYATYLKNVKKLSRQEILEWIDKEYPKGCSYKNVGRTIYKTPQKRTCTPRFCSYKGIEIGNGFVYYDGNWAEKLEDVKPKTPTTKEMLVFGKYPIGSHVVSLVDREDHRSKGDVFEVLKYSDRNCLYYRQSTNSPDPTEWREATDEEVAEYKKRGSTYNISELKANSEPKHPQVGDIMVNKVNHLIGRLTSSHYINTPYGLRHTRFNHGTYDHFYGICVGELSEFRDATSTEVALYLEACKNNSPSASRGLRPTMSVIDETMMYQPVTIKSAYLGTIPPVSRDHRLITNSRPSIADGKEAMLKYAIADYPIGTIILDHNGKQVVVEETPRWDRYDGSEIVACIGNFISAFIWYKTNGWATIIGRTVSNDSSSVGKKNSIIDRYVKENPEDLLG